MPDIQAGDLTDPGTRVPHEHNERPVTRPGAGVYEDLDVFPCDELVYREIGLDSALFDVLEQFVFLVGEEPAAIEFQFKNILVDRDGTEMFSAVNDVVLDVGIDKKTGILELIPFEERIEFPDLGIDGLVFQLRQFHIADISIQMCAVSRIKVLEIVQIIHEASLHYAVKRPSPRQVNV
jgi:hypothetical protein